MRRTVNSLIYIWMLARVQMNIMGESTIPAKNIRAILAKIKLQIKKKNLIV